MTIYGDGSQTRSFQYVSDLVAGLVALMDGEHPGPINIGNPGEFTMTELAENVAQVVNPTATTVFKENTSDDPGRRRPDISKAKALLNWEPKVPLAEGAREKMVGDFKQELGVEDGPAAKAKLSYKVTFTNDQVCAPRALTHLESIRGDCADKREAFGPRDGSRWSSRSRASGSPRGPPRRAARLNHVRLTRKSRDGGKGAEYARRRILEYRFARLPEAFASIFSSPGATSDRRVSSLRKTYNKESRLSESDLGYGRFRPTPVGGRPEGVCERARGGLGSFALRGASPWAPSAPTLSRASSKKSGCTCARRVESCAAHLLAAEPGFGSMPLRRRVDLCYLQFLHADMNVAGSGCLGVPRPRGRGRRSGSGRGRARPRWPPRRAVRRGGERLGEFQRPVRGPAGVREACAEAGADRRSEQAGGVRVPPDRSAGGVHAGGTKLALTRARVDKNGALRLSPENVAVLGGGVSHLEEARRRVVERWKLPNRPTPGSEGGGAKATRTPPGDRRRVRRPGDAAATGGTLPPRRPSTLDVATGRSAFHVRAPVGIADEATSPGAVREARARDQWWT